MLSSSSHLHYVLIYNKMCVFECVATINFLSLEHQPTKPQLKQLNLNLNLNPNPDPNPNLDLSVAFSSQRAILNRPGSIGAACNE